MVSVSILMNGYNAQKYLKEAINSIYNQTYQDWEIIFIDNCSTDNTKKIIDMYDDKIKYYKTSKNVSLGEARNFGLRYCKAEYLAFLDTDDIWMENKLKKQIQQMSLNGEFQMCYTGVIYIDENSTQIGDLVPSANSGNVFPVQLNRYEINMQSVLLRNNIKIKFNETMQFSPDFDLFMKISSEYDVGVIHEYLVKYRKLKDSLTSKKIDRWWVEMKQTLDFLFEKNLTLRSRYPKAYKMAYAKVAYNKAQYLISQEHYAEATQELSVFKFMDYKYFILYIVSKLPSKVWYFIHRYK